MSKQEQNKQLLEGEHSVKGQVKILKDEFKSSKDFTEVFGIKIPEESEDKDVGSI